MAVQFPAEVQSVRFRQRWHGVSRDGEGEDANGCKCGFLLCDKRKAFLPLFFIVYENCIENAVKLC